MRFCSNQWERMEQLYQSYVALDRINYDFCLQVQSPYFYWPLAEAHRIEEFSPRKHAVSGCHHFSFGPL